jgi:tRNA(Met) C34 N-acetyltransferase TmcA
MIAGVASGRAFDMVIVDEAQDLDPTIVPRIANLVRGGGHLLLLGDDHQLLRTGNIWHCGRR